MCLQTILLAKYYLQAFFLLLIYNRGADMDLWKINGNTCAHHTSSLANEVQISSETQFNNKNVTEQLKEQLSEYNGRKGKKGTRYCL